MPGEQERWLATIYWCPRCNVQSERAFHFCEKGPALIPQMDTETECDVIVVEVDASARVQELEGQLEATLNLNRQHVENCRELDQQRWAAESHLARLEEVVAKLAERHDDLARATGIVKGLGEQETFGSVKDRERWTALATRLYEFALWLADYGPAALTHSTPPSTETNGND